MAGFPRHIETLRANSAEVGRLLDIHTELTGRGAGRRHNVQVLNKSAILMIVATWQSVVEELALLSVDFLTDEVDEPTLLPPRMLRATSLMLQKNPHDNEVWKLAGDGWRVAVNETTKTKVAKLNTPSATNIDELFDSVLGYQNLSRQWKWKGASRRNVKDRLDSLIDLRHEIAHQVQASRSVTKAYVKQSLTLVFRVSAISSNRLRAHLYKVSGDYPWGPVRLGASL